MIGKHTLYRVIFGKMGGNVREVHCFFGDNQNFLHPPKSLFKQKTESEVNDPFPDLECG